MARQFILLDKWIINSNAIEIIETASEGRTQIHFVSGKHITLTDSQANRLMNNIMRDEDSYE